jgi:hypothetical protein
MTQLRSRNARVISAPKTTNSTSATASNAGLPKTDLSPENQRMIGRVFCATNDITIDDKNSVLVADIAALPASPILVKNWYYFRQRIFAHVAGFTGTEPSQYDHPNRVPVDGIFVLLLAMKGFDLLVATFIAHLNATNESAKRKPPASIPPHIDQDPSGNAVAWHSYALCTKIYGMFPDMNAGYTFFVMNRSDFIDRL